MFQSTDDELVARIAQGDERAFRKLFDRHSPKVLGYCRRFMGSPSGGEDMTQEIWMKVIRAAPSYRGEGKFTAWLMTLARTTCISELRKQRRLQETAMDEAMEFEPADLQPLLEDAMEREQTLTRLKLAIDALPDMQRAVLTMWLGQTCSYEDISLSLQLTVGAVKSLLFRAKQSLEKEMRKSS